MAILPSQHKQQDKDVLPFERATGQALAVSRESGVGCPNGVPVCDADGIIVERADPARVRRLLLAPNATAVRKRATPEQRKVRAPGEIVRINLASDGDDWLEISMRGDPRKYTFLDRSECMPYGVQTLRHLPKSTASLYCTVRTDCLKAA